MGSDTFDGGNDGEYNCVGFGKLSKILATQDSLFLEAEPFDRVYEQPQPNVRNQLRKFQLYTDNMLKFNHYDVISCEIYNLIDTFDGDCKRRAQFTTFYGGPAHMSAVFIVGGASRNFETSVFCGVVRVGQGGGQSVT